MDKILEDINESMQTAIPIKVKINGKEVLMHVLSFDKVEAMGKKGGVLALFLEETR